MNNKPTRQRLHARTRRLTHHLRGDALALDLLQGILADLDSRLCVHIPPPSAAGQDVDGLVPRRPPEASTEEEAFLAWVGRPED
jgi:hypothetical protein